MGSGGETCRTSIESLREDLNNGWEKKIIAAGTEDLFQMWVERIIVNVERRLHTNMSIRGHHASCHPLTTIHSIPSNCTNRHGDRS